MELAYIPSPSRSQYDLWFVPLRGYAFCILVGLFFALWLGRRRWIARGGRSGTVGDIAVWAVPFGLLGGRLYHVITDYQLYFGKGRDPIDAFKVWEGGLGIWGAIALGAVGAWIGCRRMGIPLPAYADAVAPGIAFAQAIGRWGNWFNQELFGKPTDLPWAVEIDASHRPPQTPDIATYHPTFLYESLWCIGVGLLVIWADRRFRLGHGRAFAVYVAAYTVGRFWIEYLRIDEAHHFLGLRLNDWTAIVVFLAAVTYFVISAKRRPGREEAVEPAAVAAPAPIAEPAAGAERQEAAPEPGEASQDPEAEPEPEPSAEAEAEPEAAAQPETVPRQDQGPAADEERETSSEAPHAAQADGDRPAEAPDAPEGAEAHPSSKR